LRKSFNAELNHWKYWKVSKTLTSSLQRKEMGI
jgi:hypothetical protein